MTRSARFALNQSCKNVLVSLVNDFLIVLDGGAWSLALGAPRFGLFSQYCGGISGDVLSHPFGRRVAWMVRDLVCCYLLEILCQPWCCSGRKPSPEASEAQEEAPAEAGLVDIASILGAPTVTVVRSSL
jgi:hypothetical protein